MARPLRIEFPNALYHLTSRGNRRENIYLDDNDRVLFLDILLQVQKRFNWVCHVFQGRYKAILVQKDAYLLELSRYIVLNPVHAGMVRSAKDWSWSSYRATAGLVQVPEWLHVDWLLSCFGIQKKRAARLFRQFVADGKNHQSPLSKLRNQIYLGDDAFIEAMQATVEKDADLSEVAVVQKRKLAEPIKNYLEKAATRNEGIYSAYQSGGYSMKAISDEMGLHNSTVSKIIKTHENS